MAKHRPQPDPLSAFVMSVLALLLVCPVSAQAGKKKDVPAPPVNLRDQRSKAYFDISKIVWPNPPAIPRVMFQGLFTGEKVDPTLFAKKAHKQSWMDRLAGPQSTDEVKVDTLPFQLIRTYGVGVDTTGTIYAADQAVGAVFVFDADQKHVELIGNGRQASFGLIVGVALDDDNRLFVSDAKLHHILEFNAKHEQEATIGTEVLVRPGGVAIDHENRYLYVVDAGNDVVDVFDADKFKLLRQIGKPSKRHEQTEPGTFALPEAVAVDGEGNVYVTDTLNNRIQIFDAEGGFISMFGKNGDGPADLERPKGVAIDCDGHVWVVDAAQNRVKVFDRQGRLLIYFGGQGYYPGQFMGPWGIAIDSSNRVIVSETFPGRVQVFRYVTDAEAADLKAQRDGDGTKLAAAATPQQAKPTKQAPESNAAAPAQQDSAAH